MTKDTGDQTRRTGKLVEYLQGKIAKEELLVSDVYQVYEEMVHIVWAVPREKRLFSTSYEPSDLMKLARFVGIGVCLQQMNLFPAPQETSPYGKDPTPIIIDICFNILADTLLRRNLDPTAVIRFGHLFKKGFGASRQINSGDLERGFDELEVSLDLLRLKLRSEMEPGTQIAPKNNNPMSDDSFDTLEPATQTPPEKRPNLTDTESYIIETVGNKTLTGEEIASKSGYPYNSNFKQTLSSLRKRDILRNHAPGYSLNPAYQFLVNEQDQGQDKGQD